MHIPDKVVKKIFAKISEHPQIKTGKVLLITEFDYFEVGLGTVKIKVSNEECFRSSEFC